MAFVEPPIAWRTTMALWNEEVVRILWGVRLLEMAWRAAEPVCSAMRRRREETAGAEAPT